MDTVSAHGSCPSCGALLTPDSSAAGLCVACLLTTALEPDDDFDADQEEEPQPADLAPGSTLGRFRIGRLLGKGGMAAVYEAREAPPLERTVALKVLPPQFLHDDTFAIRFAQEARVVASLEHASIVPIYASGIDDHLPWMSMRLLGGGNLSALLREGKLSWERMTEILRDVADAVDYAHAAGVIHRDIKPSNILLDRTGRAFVADFGLARLVERPAALTQTGTMIGTPHYMAPEQALGNPLDHRCDIYGLGVVAYEMLTGSTPFQGDSPIAILMKHVNDSVPVPSRDIVSDAQFEVLKKALAKSPLDRWPSAGAFVRTLEASRKTATPFNWLGLVRNHTVRTASGLALTAGAATLVWMMTARTGEDTPRSEPTDAPAIVRPAPAPQPTVAGQPSPPEPPEVSAGSSKVRPMRNNRPQTRSPGVRPPGKLDAERPEERAVEEEKPQTEAQPEAAAEEGVAVRGRGEIAEPPPVPMPNEPRTAVITDPRRLHKVDPVYPDIAKRLDLQGNVVLQARVETDGRVTPLKILKSPHPSMSDAATRAVREYRYRPALRDGVPFESILEITIEFRLKQ